MLLEHMDSLLTIRQSVAKWTVWPVFQHSSEISDVEWPNGQFGQFFDIAVNSEMLSGQMDSLASFLP